MIKKTHSVKSLSDTRASEGTPGDGEVDTENEWEKEKGGRHGDNKPALKDLKRSTLKQLLLVFIMGDYRDGDSHIGPTILWNLCLISVGMERWIKLNIYLHLILESLKCH